MGIKNKDWREYMKTGDMKLNLVGTFLIVLVAEACF